MSPDLLSQLGPETHRVIAAAFIHERTFGKPMIPRTIQNLCQAEGASYSACLVVILGKGLNKAGWPVSLNDRQGVSVRVPDEETEAALDWRERIDPI
jgi:hypothetical protein